MDWSLDQKDKISDHFLKYILPEMKKSVESKDTIVFKKRISNTDN